MSNARMHEALEQTRQRQIVVAAKDVQREISVCII